MLLRIGSTTLLLAIAITSHAQFIIELRDSVFVGAVGRISDRMIVAFDELAPIGVVQNQEMAANVFLQGPVGMSLMSRLHRSTPEQGPDREVVLKLGQLRLLQVGSNMQIGMHMEFLEHSMHGYTRLYEHAVSSIHTSAGKRDVPQIIAQAFQECLSAFEMSSLESAGSNELFDALQVQEPMVRVSSDLKAWNGTSGRSGVYRTFNDFLMDRPDSIGLSKREMVRSLYDDQLVKLRQVDRETRMDIWGFTDGQHIYKNLGGEFVRLERYEEMYRARWQAPAQVDAAAMLVGGILGGLIGAAVAGGLSSSPGDVIQYELDPLSGDLWPASERNVRPGYRSIHLFEFSRYSKQDAEVIVTMEGEEPVRLNKEQWTVLRPEPRLSSASVVVSSDGDIVNVDMDRNARRTEVYLIHMKADGLMSVKRLSEQMARKKIDTLKKESRR